MNSRHLIRPLPQQYFSRLPVIGARRIGLRHRNRSKWAKAAVGVRRAKAALSSGCKPHPAIAPAGSNRSSYGGNEMAEAFG
jgi:hypothetical protein